MKNFIFFEYAGTAALYGYAALYEYAGTAAKANRRDKSILQLSWTRLLLSIKGPALISK